MKSIKVNDYSEIPKNYTGHVEYTNGTQYWYKNGNLHREDGPATIYPDDTQEWWKNGKKIYIKENYYRKLHKLGIITEQELFVELL